MTDHETPADGGGAEESAEPALWDVDADADDFLGLLAKLAHAGAEIGITLHVPGGVVSGLLCSGATYFKGVKAAALAGWKGEGAESMGELLDNRIAAYDPKKPITIGYIHLRDAKTFLSGDSPAVPSGKGVYWRGRISAVSGWSMGQLRSS